jgi:hypothetical protein
MSRDSAHRLGDAESARILDLYDSAIRESAGQHGVPWLARTPPEGGPTVRDTLRDSWSDIPVDVDLAPASPHRSTTMVRRRRRTHTEVTTVKTSSIETASSGAAWIYLRMVALTACVGFVTIAMLLVADRYGGSTVRAIVQKLGHGIHSVRP